MLCPNLCGVASLPPMALTSATPNVWIEMVNPKDNIYTTLDEVSGCIKIEVEREIPLEKIDISLEGTSSTSLSRAIAFVPGRRESFQRFLQISQPTNESDYPKIQTLLPGKQYKLPFSFIIPQSLLPQSCNHETRNTGVKNAHLRLPPTLGNGPTPFWDLRSTPDDSSEMCRIRYGVRVEVYGKSSSEPICDLSQDIRVIPSTIPTEKKTDDPSVLYMLKEQALTSGFGRREHGNLEISATKPNPITIQSTETGSTNASPTALQLHLRFDPVKNELPPRLSSLKCNLNTSTFYATVPWENYPSQNDITALQVDREVYEKSMSLSSLDLSSVKWEKLPSFSSIYQGKLKGDDESDVSFPCEEQIESWNQCSYTATVTVPIILSQKKDFLPTFHSCAVSRSYALDISLGHRVSSGLCGSSTNFSVPVELAYSGRE